MYIRGIILAAGMAKRMGSNKLSLKLGNKTVLEKVIENAKASKLDEIVLVTGRYDVNTDIVKIHNADFEEGMSTSIRKGLKNFEGDAVIILLGDMPFIGSDIINKLISSFKKSKKNIGVPIFQGQRGNPVIIGKKYFEVLMQNSGDKGAREIIKGNNEDVEFISFDNSNILLDIDEISTYKQILSEGIGKGKR